MTEYEYRRAVIEQRIREHSVRRPDGSLMFPRCLAADLRQIELLEKEYETDTLHHA